MRASRLVLALVLAGCAGGPSAEERAAEATRIRGLAADSSVHCLSIQPETFEDGVRKAAAAVAFAAGASGRDDAAEEVERTLRPDAPDAQVAAAAMGLGFCKSDATEGVLVRLAQRPSHPPEALEAMFGYFRTRGPDKPPPSTIPPALIEIYAVHPEPRGRAALAHLGRASKDAALVPHLERLAKDDSWEVRRAVALALAEGPAKVPRPRDLAKRCIAALRSLANDADPRVVASACRAIASYDDEISVGTLFFALHHADFNVRVAALEGLGKRKAAGAVAELERVAKSDPSASCRYTAGVQLAEINETAARALVEGLLADKSVYVQTAGAEILGKAEDADASKRLAAIAKSAAHVRVRETAVGGLEGKKDDVSKEAVRTALLDADVGVASVACGVVMKNEWKDLTDAVAAVPARFPGCLGADAREAAIAAVLELDGANRHAFFEPFVADENPAVRAAAQTAIAKLDMKPPPKEPQRGADLSGELLPGGAPIFGPEPFLVLETDQGTMKIRLFPEQAPVHCAHVAALARNGFYDGLTWHRVVPDFVIQGGCPRGDGSGNAGVTLPLEPTMIPFERGTLGMPRSDHPDTGGCQLFICHSRAPHLDVRYTAFGKVVEGFDVIDRIDVDSKIVHARVEGVR